MNRPPALGTVWTARATFYDADGHKIGSAMDTPNSIAKALMEHPEAASVKALGEGTQMREHWASRMADWNVAESQWVAR